MSNNVTRMDIKEFREKGYLQEANRQFFHPLGLALEIMIENDGSEKLGGIWDYRNDPEGLYFNLEDSDDERIKTFNERANHIQQEMEGKKLTRKESLGFFIEPIPNNT